PTACAICFFSCSNVSNTASRLLYEACDNHRAEMMLRMRRWVGAAWADTSISCHYGNRCERSQLGPATPSGSRQVERNFDDFLGGDRGNVEAQFPHQAEHGCVVGKHLTDQAAHAAFPGDRDQALDQLRADPAALPGIANHQSELSIA